MTEEGREIPLGFIKKALSRAIKWVWAQIKEEFTAPFEELSKKIDTQDAKIELLKEKMESAHQYDPAARECDLASLDDQICQQIERCRQRGYTTAEERRRVGRMHRAYHARGGNDGETEEYTIFCKLPTEEEFEHAKGA